MQTAEETDSVGVRAQVQKKNGMVFITVPTWWKGRMVHVYLEPDRDAPHFERGYYAHELYRDKTGKLVPYPSANAEISRSGIPR